MQTSTLIPAGACYQATVPDTLDLAERARIAIHGLAGSLDPEGIHEMYFIMGLGCLPADRFFRAKPHGEGLRRVA